MKSSRAHLRVTKDCSCHQNCSGSSWFTRTSEMFSSRETERRRQATQKAASAYSTPRVGTTLIRRRHKTKIPNVWKTEKHNFVFCVFSRTVNWLDYSASTTLGFRAQHNGRPFFVALPFWQWHIMFSVEKRAVISLIIEWCAIPPRRGDNGSNSTSSLSAAAYGSLRRNNKTNRRHVTEPKVMIRLDDFAQKRKKNLSYSMLRWAHPHNTLHRGCRRRSEGALSTLGWEQQPVHSQRGIVGHVTRPSFIIFFLPVPPFEMCALLLCRASSFYAHFSGVRHCRFGSFVCDEERTRRQREKSYRFCV